VVTQIYKLTICEDIQLSCAIILGGDGKRSFLKECTVYLKYDLPNVSQHANHHHDQIPSGILLSVSIPKLFRQPF